MELASHKRILVVDDEPDIRDFISACLEDAGFEVETAFDGIDALEKIKESIPDLITLDLVMPRMSGRKLMSTLFEKEEWKKIPVIMITAHAQDEMGQTDVKELLKKPSTIAPQHIIDKPITPAKLVSVVANILSVKTELDVANERQSVLEMVKSCLPEKLKEIRDILG